MVCSDFAVIRKLYIQENKEIFMNTFTGFIPPIHFISPQYKNFLAPLNPQFREHIYNQNHTSG